MLPAKPPAAPTSEADTHTDSPPQSEEGEVSSHLGPTPSASVETKNSQDREPTDPPLPDEAPPPLPNEPPPSTIDEDDGWEPIWDESAQAFYFFNKHTQASQWENPRVPDNIAAPTKGIADVGPPGAAISTLPRKPAAGGYDPAIHGDYDPNADYARVHDSQSDQMLDGQGALADPSAMYAATGAFNRFTGKWQSADINPDKFSDENKSRRQMNAFFDVDAAANSHDGRSLKAERSGKKLSKAELKAFREKRREKKEEKRRAWLRD